MGGAFGSVAGFWLGFFLLIMRESDIREASTNDTVEGSVYEP